MPDKTLEILKLLLLLFNFKKTIAIFIPVTTYALLQLYTNSHVKILYIAVANLCKYKFLCNKIQEKIKDKNGRRN